MIYGYIVCGPQLRVGIGFNHSKLGARGDKRINLRPRVCAFYGSLTKVIAAFSVSTWRRVWSFPWRVFLGQIVAHKSLELLIIHKWKDQITLISRLSGLLTSRTRATLARGCGIQLSLLPSRAVLTVSPRLPRPCERLYGFAPRRFLSYSRGPFPLAGEFMGERASYVLSIGLDGQASPRLHAFLQQTDYCQT